MNRRGDFIEGKIHSFIQRRGLGPRKDTANAVAQQIKRLTQSDIKDSKITIGADGTIRLKRN